MKRILITRPRGQAGDFAAALQEAGFEPIFFPVIEIRPIRDNRPLASAFRELSAYAWIVFTSANAVEVVFDEFGLLLQDRRRTARIAAIGPKTAEALAKRGLTVDFVPDEYVAEAILVGLGDLRGKRVLLPRAEIARQVLPDAIAKAGGIPDEIAVYTTVSSTPDPDGLAALRSGVDWITFTSPSTVRSFVEIVRGQDMDPLALSGHPGIACIGPITERAARAAGFQTRLVADSYTTEGLVRALRGF
jgi:uroporphyrinogen-III synthase